MVRIFAIAAVVAVVMGPLAIGAPAQTTIQTPATDEGYISIMPVSPDILPPPRLFPGVKGPGADLAVLPEKRPELGLTPPAALAATVTANFNGASRRGADREPPDPHAAASVAYIVEVTNSHLDIFNKATHAKAASYTLNGFWNYALNNPKLQLFDPRVVYDPNFQRFVVVAEARHDTNNTQYMFVAVSKTANPLGGWYKYTVPVYHDVTFFDQPKLGLSYYSVVIAGDAYSSEAKNPSYLGSYVWGWAKSDLYAGRPISIRAHFAGKLGSPSPAVAVPEDRNHTTYVLTAAGGGGSALYLFRFFNAGFSNETFTGPTTIAIPAYRSPLAMSAIYPRQYGTTIRLDPSDARLASAPMQNGAGVWAVHTILASNNTAVPRWYQINVSTASMYQQGMVFRSATSDDWNPAIGANRANYVVLTWSATDQANGINAEVEYAARTPSDAVGKVSSKGTLVRSATYYDPVAFTFQPERWGDFAAVALDPAAYGTCPAYYRMWVVNEDIITHDVWGTRLARVGFC
jgi:hypothetical protein